MRVLDKERVIVMNESEYKKAQRCGNKMYEMLTQAKLANPTYSVKIEKKRQSPSNYKRINKKYILSFVEMHNPEQLEDYEALINNIGGIDFKGNTITFFSIRKKFLEAYPQLMTEKDRAKFEAKKENPSNTIKMPEPKADLPMASGE